MYSWSYRPKILRTKKRPQQFYWKYRGRYGSAKFDKYVETLSEEQKEELKKDYESRVAEQELEKAIIDKMLLIEPYNTEDTLIKNIRNSQTRSKKAKIFDAKLRILAQQQLQHMS